MAEFDGCLLLREIICDGEMQDYGMENSHCAWFK